MQEINSLPPSIYCRFFFADSQTEKNQQIREDSSRKSAVYQKRKIKKTGSLFFAWNATPILPRYDLFLLSVSKADIGWPFRQMRWVASVFSFRHIGAITRRGAASFFLIGMDVVIKRRGVFFVINARFCGTDVPSHKRKKTTKGIVSSRFPFSTVKGLFCHPLICVLWFSKRGWRSVPWAREPYKLVVRSVYLFYIGKSEGVERGGGLGLKFFKPGSLRVDINHWSPRVLFLLSPASSGTLPVLH